MSGANGIPVDTSQLLKGVLDLAVLAVLSDKDSYGYDVSVSYTHLTLPTICSV